MSFHTCTGSIRMVIAAGFLRAWIVLFFFTILYFLVNFIHAVIERDIREVISIAVGIAIAAFLFGIMFSPVINRSMGK